MAVESLWRDTSHSIDGYRVRGAGKGVAYYYMGEKKTVVVKGCRLIPVKGPENKRLLREKGGPPI